MPDFSVVAERGRYVLGEEDDAYGIWDLDAGVDEPVERFPVTDDGFEAAWDRLGVLARAESQATGKIIVTLVVLGVVLWVLGTVSSVLVFLEGHTPDWPLEVFGTIGQVGFRLAVGALLVFAAIILVRRARPPSSVSNDPTTTSGIDRVLRVVMVSGLVLWTVADLVIAVAPSEFAPPQGFIQLAGPSEVERYATVVEVVAFDVWVASATLIVMRWLVRWHPSPAPLSEARGPRHRTRGVER